MTDPIVSPDLPPSRLDSIEQMARASSAQWGRVMVELVQEIRRLRHLAGRPGADPVS